MIGNHLAYSEAPSGVVSGSSRCTISQPEEWSQCLLLLSVLLLQGLHHRRVGQGGGVALGPAFCRVPQEPPHNLAAAGLGQLGGEVDIVSSPRLTRFYISVRCCSFAFNETISLILE